MLWAKSRPLLTPKKINAPPFHGILHLNYIISKTPFFTPHELPRALNSFWLFPFVREHQPPTCGRIRPDPNLSALPPPHSAHSANQAPGRGQTRPPGRRSVRAPICVRDTPRQRPGSARVNSSHRTPRLPEPGEPGAFPLPAPASSPEPPAYPAPAGAARPPLLRADSRALGLQPASRQVWSVRQAPLPGPAPALFAPLPGGGRRRC